MGGVAAVGVDEKERKRGAVNGRSNGQTGKDSSDANIIVFWNQRWQSQTTYV